MPIFAFDMLNILIIIFQSENERRKEGGRQGGRLLENLPDFIPNNSVSNTLESRSCLLKGTLC